MWSRRESTPHSKGHCLQGFVQNLHFGPPLCPPFGAVSGNANNTTGYTWRKVAKLLPPFTTQAGVQLQLAA